MKNERRMPVLPKIRNQLLMFGHRLMRTSRDIDIRFPNVVTDILNDT